MLAAVFPKMFEFKSLEPAIIVGVGLLMHLNRISVIELKYSRLPMLTPNSASTLFVFSVLCVLSKLRPLWPNALRKPQKFLIFCIELALILYATDFLLRQVWLPSLKLLNFMCHFLGQYVIVANQDFLAHNAPLLSQWIRNDAFYLARFLLAIVAFIFMMDTTGFLEYVKCKIRKPKLSFLLDGNVMLSEVDESVLNEPMDGSIDADEPFDVTDLPYVPQEDLLNLGHRVGARRRRNPMRKSKRAAKLVLNDPDNECFC